MKQAFGLSRTAWGMVLAAVVGIAMSAPELKAQEPGNAPETKAPQAAGATATQSTPATTAAPQAKAPPTAAEIIARRSHDAYWIEHDKLVLVDFGDLGRFKAADAALPPPAPGDDRVVFMGDSITQGWKLETSFPGKPYINRGISGQTSPQMLVRFRQDVIDVDAKVVVILAGTNDLAENTGPMTLHETEENLASMADLATANHIKVVLCSITPSVNFPWFPGLDPAPKIAAINAWIKDYAAQKGYVYVDYFGALADPSGGFPQSLSFDGVHPKPAGYAIMAPLAEAGIEKALAQ